MMENMIRNYAKQKNNTEYQILKSTVLRIIADEDRRRGL